MDFSVLADLYQKLESTTKRLEMADDLAAFFKEVNPGLSRRVVYLLQGIIAPAHHGVDLGVADKICIQALVKVSGKTLKQVDAAYRKTGDLGKVAENLCATKSQARLGGTILTIEKVYQNLHKVALVSGSGSQEQKIRLLSELFSDATPLEAKAIARFVNGTLRLGVAESTIIDALSVMQTGDKQLKPVLERAFNFTSDLGLVAETFLVNGMSQVEAFAPTPFSPIRPALAERLPSAEKIIEKLGPCSVEAKYDGLRLQVHLLNGNVRIFSRREEEVTLMFPDIAMAAKKQFSASSAIFEGEAIGVDSSGGFFPFQKTIQRKRIHGVAQAAKNIPLKLFCFELLYVDGVDMTGEPYAARQAELKKRVMGKGILEVAHTEIVDSSIRLQQLFDELVASGLEGVIAKDLGASYAAGARKFAWIKLKRSYSTKLADSLDVVIIGFYYGKGKRTEFGLGGLLTAVYDADADRYCSIAKIGTGFSEEQLKDFRTLLDPDVVKEKPKNVDSLIEPDEWVFPKFVVTVIADELTRSPTHTAGWTGKEGLALRFPRLKGFVRMDKRAADATTVKEAVTLYEMQQQR